MLTFRPPIAHVEALTVIRNHEQHLHVRDVHLHADPVRSRVLPRVRQRLLHDPHELHARRGGQPAAVRKTARGIVHDERDRDPVALLVLRHDVAERAGKAFGWQADLEQVPDQLPHFILHLARYLGQPAQRGPGLVVLPGLRVKVRGLSLHIKEREALREPIV